MSEQDFDAERFVEGRLPAEPDAAAELRAMLENSDESEQDGQAALIARGIEEMNERAAQQLLGT